MADSKLRRKHTKCEDLIVLNGSSCKYIFVCLIPAPLPFSFLFLDLPKARWDAKKKKEKAKGATIKQKNIYLHELPYTEMLKIWDYLTRLCQVKILCRNCTWGGEKGKNGQFLNNFFGPGTQGGSFVQLLGMDGGIITRDC